MVDQEWIKWQAKLRKFTKGKRTWGSVRSQMLKGGPGDAAAAGGGSGDGGGGDGNGAGDGGNLLRKVKNMNRLTGGNAKVAPVSFVDQKLAPPAGPRSMSPTANSFTSEVTEIAASPTRRKVPRRQTLGAKGVADPGKISVGGVEKNLTKKDTLMQVRARPHPHTPDCTLGLWRKVAAHGGHGVLLLVALRDTHATGGGFAGGRAWRRGKQRTCDPINHGCS